MPTFKRIGVNPETQPMLPIGRTQTNAVVATATAWRPHSLKELAEAISWIVFWLGVAGTVAALFLAVAFIVP